MSPVRNLKSHKCSIPTSINIAANLSKLSYTDISNGVRKMLKLKLYKGAIKWLLMTE